jgi:acid phosphatase
MKLHRFHALALVLALLLPQSVRAWNATGHELVAGVAWDSMTPAARQKAIDILSAASDDTCLPDLFPTDSRPLAERQREFFMRAATWPDVIRDGKCKSFSRPNWHFIDRFWQGVSGATGPDAPKDRPDIPMAAENAVESLKTFRHTVACDLAPCGTNDQRAMDLAWTLHLVGDIHQPLHDSGRASSAHPQGDQGGNLFPLGTGQKPPKLHSFWDGIIDSSIPVKAGETNQKSIEYLDRVIATITQDHPRASVTASQLESGDFDVWSHEGFETSKESVYPASLHEGQPAPPAYKTMAFTIADAAIALGGYRLSDVLEVMLAGQPQAQPQPQPQPPPQPVIASSGLPSPAHIVIVIDENKGYGNIIGSGKAKYINELASRGASLTKFYASHHPSQPNYIDFFAGGTLGVCDDTCTTTAFTSQNLGAALIAAGKSFTGFAENLPPNAATVCKTGKFARKHTPWLDFSNVPSTSSKRFSQFPHDAAGFANLPDVSLVIPNLVNDMHNGNAIGAEVKAGDDWLKQNLSAYADWAEHNNSLLVVTWDEDSSSYTINCANGVITTKPPKNHIATIVMGEPVIPGTKSTTVYTHADLLRTILDIYAITPFGDAAPATDITGIWK